MSLFGIVVLIFLNIRLAFTANANYSVVFQSGEEGYFCVRIPSILTTSKGTLLAFGEGRMFNCADATQHDLVYKRSTDNGRTWSKLRIFLPDNSTKNAHNGIRNIVPVQLKYNQRILLPFCQHGHILQSYSDDDGLTFAKPEIIPNVTKPEWQAISLGPPSSILLQSNRILIPAHYALNTSEGGAFSIGYTMLNDHNGQIDKWYLGGEFKLGNLFPNEAQAVELLPNNNSIFINSRSRDTVRIGSYSYDGGITFSKVNVLNTLIQPLHGCEGSTIFHPKTNQLLYTGLSELSQRTNLSLYISTDHGNQWSFKKTIWPGPSAYSALTILNDQSVGVLFEGGNQTPYDKVFFTILI